MQIQSLRIEFPDGLAESHAISRHLKGYNLEMTGACHDGLLADRLRNPKFFGPADLFGVPPGWHGGSVSHCRSVPGLGWSGSEALLLTPPCSLRQGGLHVAAGEELEIQVAAKTRHAPVKLSFAVKTEAMRSPPLASAEIMVDTPCWKIFQAPVKIPADCARATFHLAAAGHGELHLDQVHLRPRGQFLSREVVEAFRSLNMGALRFPGGCISTVYDWRKGLGPVERRPVCPDPQFNHKIAYDFGLREFLDLCRELDCTPQLTLPLGQGTPADAADLADFCQAYYRQAGVNPPLILFQVGNEQYARHSMSHMGIHNYLELLRETVPLLKTNYPHCKIIGIYSFVDKDPWRAQLLDEAGGLLDMVAYQYYKGQLKDNAADQVCNAAESVEKNRRDLLEIIAAIAARGLPLKIGFTEWNYWLHAQGLSANGEPYSVREPMDAAHCLFIAGMLQMQAELGVHVALSNFYNLLNGMSVFQNQQGFFEESSAAEVMRFYSPAFPGRCVPVRCQAPMLSGATPAAHALCVRTGAKRYLFVVNYANEPLQPVLPPPLANPRGAVLHFADCRNGEDVPPLKEPAGAILPPRSITRLEFEAQA